MFKIGMSDNYKTLTYLTPCNLTQFYLTNIQSKCHKNFWNKQNVNTFVKNIIVCTVCLFT